MKKTIGVISVFILLLVGVVAMHIVRLHSIVKGVEVTIDPNGGCLLLSESDVDSLVRSAVPGLDNLKIGDVDRASVEEAVMECPYVKNVAVKVSNGGRMIVAVTQHRPVVRMFFQDNEFYLSHDGGYMPLTRHHYCHILVGSSEYNEPVLHHPEYISLADTASHTRALGIEYVWHVARYLDDHPAYGEVFDQINVDAKGDVVLIPKLGNMSVVLGDTSLLDEKFENLWSFFDQGVKQVGWNAYSSVSVKYKGQVVCKRRDDK